jgi:Flp pilus assembly protein TadG
MAALTTARRSTERGQAVIELALTLPLLLVVVFGIIDFGFMFQRYEAVTNAAREGARIGVLADYTAARAPS